MSEITSASDPVVDESPKPVDPPKCLIGAPEGNGKAYAGSARPFRLFDIFRNSPHYLFGLSLMDYDEHAKKKFSSLLADYYTLGLDQEPCTWMTKRQNSAGAMDGPDGKKVVVQGLQDYLLEGYLRTARQIVAKYVRSSDAPGYAGTERIDETANAPKNENSQSPANPAPVSTAEISGWKAAPSMEDVIRLEQCIIRFLPEVEMSLRGIRIQHKFSEIVGDTIYQRILEKFEKEPLDTPEKVLKRRTEIDFMLQTIEEAYITAADRDRFRFRIWMFNFLFMIGFYVASSVLILSVGEFGRVRHYWTDSPWSMLSYLVVPFMGSLGAFISIQQKNECVPVDGDIFRKSLELNSGLLGTIMRLLFGAIFAILLNLFFVAGYITSSLFPNEFQRHEGQGIIPALGFLWNIDSYSAGEVAKIMTWSLVAGFAERIIPDNLDRLSKSLLSKETKEAGKRIDGPVSQISSPASPAAGTPSAGGPGSAT